MDMDNDSVADLLSGYIRAKDLEVGVKLEMVVVRSKRETFEEKGESVTKVVIILDDGRQVVCNKARLREMTRAFGLNRSNWVNQTVRVSRGMTQFAGDAVPCVVLEPVATPRIAAQPPKRPKMIIESGRPAERNDPAAGPIDDDIPF
jgi:hypothetical protein